jgi:hypothetical protein
MVSYVAVSFIRSLKLYTEMQRMERVALGELLTTSWQINFGVMKVRI